MNQSPLYDAVTQQIDESMWAADRFHGHVLQYRDSVADDDPYDLDRMQERAVDAWTDAEYQRRQVDGIIDDLGMEVELTVRDGQTGAADTSLLSIDSVQGLLHCTRRSAQEATVVDPHPRYSAADVDAMQQALDDRYTDLAEMNRTYLAAVDEMATLPDLVAAKTGRERSVQTPYTKEYRAIEDMIAQRATSG